ncbi:helix-turn-helix domain-containing protein [Brucella sp. 22210]|uniref:helix-turn-helix domain-containing protein n=1 Tax=Brucella sp. 22210 TaxID=3453892 RepID=UPI003F86C742
MQRRFDVSRAHLDRAFATVGGVARVLQDRRLDLALLKLTRKSDPPDSIATITASPGFSSGNQLLRSFRAQFGVTPGEAREESAAFSPSIPGSSHLQTHFGRILGQRLSDRQYADAGAAHA